MKNIGLFGGTFDPFHLGHSTIIRSFIQKCNIDICYIIPAKCSPFKQNKINKFSDEERILLINNEIKNIPNTKLSLFEINKNEISFFIDTINHYKKKHPTDNFFLLIGYDVAITFHKWKDFSQILSLSTVVIANRTENNTHEHDIQIQKTFENYQPIWLDNPIIDISSSQLRNL